MAAADARAREELRKSTNNILGYSRSGLADAVGLILARPAHAGFDAQVDQATGLIRGMVTASDGTTSTVRSRPYGSAATEIGRSFILGRGDERGVGYLIGLR